MACLLQSGESAASTRTLTFEERVEAQRAIERVYFSYLTGARRPFEQAVTQAVLEGKVITYLKQSAALEQHWQTPITAEMLRAETERIARNSRFPERLAEIDAALGHDDFLVQETLVRAALVDRLSRSFYTSDERIHVAARAEADLLHQQLVDGVVDPAANHPRRTILEAVALADEAAPPVPSPTPGLIGSARLVRVDVSMEELRTLRKSVPATPGEIGPVQDEPGAFTIRVMLASEPGMARIASYTVPKIPWESWWTSHDDGFDGTRIVAAADGGGSTFRDLATRRNAQVCTQDDLWDNGALDDVPDARAYHAAVWTGNEMIIWGGEPAASGGRYDPLIDTWRGMSSHEAPPLGYRLTAVWTGTEMIVWGLSNDPPIAAGRYDPLSDRWSPVSTINAPTRRSRHSAVWTGREMIIWGGYTAVGNMTATGARYDPAADVWIPLSLTDAPSARVFHSAIWTGMEMIVWGGSRTPSFSSNPDDLLGSGAKYNPATDTWSTVGATNAPTPRIDHSALWTGTEMIVWGGTIPPFYLNGGTTSTGARYDPVTDTWTPTSQLNVPSARHAHSAVWTGTRMIVWSGSRDFASSGHPLHNTGGLYDPSNDTWQATSQVNATIGRSSHTAVWTGSHMIVWGGEYGGNQTFFSQRLSHGGRYDPSSDSWTHVSRSRQGVVVSGVSPIVWTGTEMLAWSIGSAGSLPPALGGGGRYDPMTDSWKDISTAGAPAARSSHVAVWTGDEMVVWGGQANFETVFGDSGKYDPISDSWRPMSQVDAPVPREGARAVWTGQEMILWGGALCYFRQGCIPYGVNTGGRYDPTTDTWRILPLLNAPPPIVNHTMVWTGHEVIVWGGYQIYCASGGCPSVFSDRGARYVPEIDAWFPLPSLPAGQRRDFHSATWTGREMIVLGGRGDSPQPHNPQPHFEFAWLYDRPSDAWSPVPSHPSYGLFGHTAAWTGRHILAWGSFSQFTSGTPGYIFDRVTQGWSRMSTAQAPMDRGGHTAVWTGSTMLVWGGYFGSIKLDSGGRYFFGQNSDDDGDGITRCAGDCDDTSASIYPGAVETCNRRDDNCDGLVDEDAAGLDTDSDGIANTCDACPNFPNPGQSSSLACMSTGPSDGQCLPAEIVLPEPIAQGVVTLVRERPGPPETIHLELNVSSCDRIDPVEVRLNGQTIATFMEPQQSCACVPPPYHVTVSDTALLAGAWRATGNNTFEIRKAGAPSPPGTYLGTFVGWVRARLESSAGQPQETLCLFDFDGGGCIEPDQCRFGATEDTLDVSFTAPASLFVEEELLSSTPFTAGQLPPTIDLGSVPDGPMKLCVGPDAPPSLYAATAGGNLYMVNPATGASTSGGTLPLSLIEIEHDDVSRRTFLQASLPGSGRIVEIDLLGGEPLAESPFLGLPLNGMEFVHGRLYGIDSRLGGVRFLEISVDTGYSRVVVDLPVGIWDGLAYDRVEGVFYTWRTFGIASALWRLDAITGEAHELHALPFEPTAMEFGPDGSLYASRAIGSDTELYHLDPATGGATLVGRMGIADVVSLATVRNLPRACLDIVKQAERTLATGGSCGAPPTANAGPDRNAECSSPAGSVVTLDGSSSSDSDSTPGTLDDIHSFEWYEGFGTPSASLLGTGMNLEVQLPLGNHDITLKVTDRSGDSSTDATAILVEDTIGPALGVSANPATLWPPNHRMVSVTTAVTASDICGAATVHLVRVTSSDPDDQDGPGDGKTANDIQSATPGTADFDLELRAERDGAGNGRLYEVVYRATDAAGNSTQSSTLVGVPHDQAGVIEPIEISMSETDLGTVVSWSPVPGALHYNVIRGRITEIRDSVSEISLGKVVCIEAGSVDSSTLGREDAGLPPPGEAFFYLTEYSDGRGSSYGEPSATKPRTVGSGGCS